MLSSQYSNRTSYTNEQQAEFNAINKQHLDKLKYLCKHGKPKQSKYAIYVLNNNFDKTECEVILCEIFNELFMEVNLKNAKTFITALIGIGHISHLIPHLVAKDIKDFIIKTVAKDLLLTPATVPLNISASELSTTSVGAKRKNSLKLAGKWCENKDELPFNTRARVCFFLVYRFCYLNSWVPKVNISGILKIDPSNQNFYQIQG